MLPVEIIRQIQTACTPWPCYCMALACKPLMRHYQDIYQGTRVFSDILDENLQGKLYDSRDKSYQYKANNKAGMNNGLGGIWGSAITIDSVLGYDVTWRCSNSDGQDGELTRRLLLVDDYWRCKTSNYISCLLGTDQDSIPIFRGRLSDITYNPHNTDTCTYLDGSGPEWEQIADICCTRREKLKSTRGLLYSRSGDVQVSKDFRRGYECIFMDVTSVEDGGQLSITVVIFCLEHCRSQ